MSANRSGYSTPNSRTHTPSSMSVSRSGKRSRGGGVPAAQLNAALMRIGGRLPATMGELKNIDTTLGVPAVGVTTGVLTLLNGTTQGTTATTRLGRRITVKSIYIRGNLTLNPTSTGFSEFRLLIVYDKQANATAPVATDILVADTINNVNNLSNSRRFVTLMDYAPEHGIGTAGPQMHQISLYKKCNLVTEFNAGSAGTIGDIQSGSIYALMYFNGRITVAAANANINVRVRFSDA